MEEPKPEAEQPEPESEQAPVTEPMEDSKSESKAEAEPVPELEQAEPMEEPKPEAEQELKPEVEAEPETEAKSKHEEKPEGDGKEVEEPVSMDSEVTNVEEAPTDDAPDHSEKNETIKDEDDSINIMLGEDEDNLFDEDKKDKDESSRNLLATLPKTASPPPPETAPVVKPFTSRDTISLASRKLSQEVPRGFIFILF